MNRNKILLSATVSAVVIGGILLGSTRAIATESRSATTPMVSLVQKIADKFGLNTNEVQAVFDQSREERQATRQAEYETKLSQLVTDGKITEAQKQLILTKHKEMETNRETEQSAMKDKTVAERRTAMEAKRTELQAWATQNGIDASYLMLGYGKRHGERGMGNHEFRDGNISSSPTVTTQ